MPIRARKLLTIVCCAVPTLLGAQNPPPSAEAKTADSLLAAKNFERAFDAFAALTRRDSTSARYWYQLGMAAASLRRYDRGATAFERSTTLLPNIAATYNAAAMHARLGHADQAFTWLARAVSQGFGDQKLLETDDDLASIRSDKRFEKIVYDATHAPTPCATDPERRKFDFWIGDWTVMTAGGTVVGSSVVQSINGGCSLLENWTAARGSTGKSLNSFNPIVSKWQQYWVDQNGGVTEYRDSEWKNGALSFQARSTRPDGTPLLQRLTFSAVSDSVVRQHGERSLDDGKTWATTFDFYYHRRR
jgi:tetratricopeptide (TPR) repeat protein